MSYEKKEKVVRKSRKEYGTFDYTNVNIQIGFWKEESTPEISESMKGNSTDSSSTQFWKDKFHQMDTIVTHYKNTHPSKSDYLKIKN